MHDGNLWKCCGFYAMVALGLGENAKIKRKRKRRRREKGAPCAQEGH